MTQTQVDDQLMAAWDSRNAETFLKLLADKFVWQDLMFPEPMTAKDQARTYMQAWFAAFPDMRAKQVNRVVSGNWVAAEVEFTGTNNGPLTMGDKQIPPTGKQIKGKGTYFVHVEGEKVVEFRSYPDIAGMMMQLGLM